MLLASLLVLLSTLTAFFFYRDTKKPKGFPPGPDWFPVIGSLLAMTKVKNQLGNLWSGVGQISDQYGPVVGLKFGLDRQVLVCGFQAVKEMLYNVDLLGRPSGFLFSSRTMGTRRGILYTDGDRWQEQRQFLVKALHGLGFVNIIEETVSDLLSRFQKTMASPVAMQEALNMAVLNTLWCWLTGTRFSPDSHQMETLFRLRENVCKAGIMYNQIPTLRFLTPRLSGQKHFSNSHRRMWEFLKDEVIAHARTLDTEKEATNFIDAYLKQIAASGAASSFNEDELVAACFDLLVMGLDSTTNTLSFIIIHLLLQPQVQRRAQEELDVVVGRSRLPSIGDKNKLPYIQAVIMETQRRSNVEPFTVSHRALRDTRLQEHIIHKGELVTASIYSVHMDQDHWGDPHAFRPERFIDQDGNLLPSERLLPFGLGNRRCAGEKFAEAILFLFLSAILQNFDLSVPPSTPAPSTESSEERVLTPNPFHAILTPRT